jgi:hypothetical protein
MSDKHLPPARVEPIDVDERLIWFGVPVLVGTVLISAAVCLWLFPGSIPGRILSQPLPQYPAPRLQVSARDEMAAFSAHEMQRLNGTGWVDRAQGVVHIPIVDAMRKVAQEGIPGWPSPAPPNVAHDGAAVRGPAESSR